MKNILTLIIALALFVPVCSAKCTDIFFQFRHATGQHHGSRLRRALTSKRISEDSDSAL